MGICRWLVGEGAFALRLGYGEFYELFREPGSSTIPPDGHCVHARVRGEAAQRCGETECVAGLVPAVGDHLVSVEVRVVPARPWRFEDARDGVATCGGEASADAVAMKTVDLRRSLGRRQRVVVDAYQTSYVLTPASRFASERASVPSCESDGGALASAAPPSKCWTNVTRLPLNAMPMFTAR